MLACCLLLVPVDTSSAAPPPGEDRLVLLHSLMGEAGYRRLPDHPAILHVFNRRRRLPEHQGKTLTQMAQAYSNFLEMDRPETPHRKAVFRHTIETSPQWMVRLVDRFLANPKRVKDPCRGKAWHFGGKFEIAVGDRRILDCGNTANWFLARAAAVGSRPPSDAAVP